jgi:hypothetical protein
MSELMTLGDLAEGKCPDNYIKEDPAVASVQAGQNVLLPVQSNPKYDFEFGNKQTNPQIALPHQNTQTQVQEGIAHLRNAANSIGEFNEAISELANFAMRVLESNDYETKLNDLEVLVNDILSKAKKNSDNAKTFAKWAKTYQPQTINDQRLNLILTAIYRIRTYIDDTNIALEQAVSIRHWQPMQNNAKYNELIRQLGGMQSKHNVPKQEGVGAIEQYKNAVHELIEAIKHCWPFDEIPSILAHLSKTVNNLGNPQTMDFTKQLKRALATKPK